MPNFLLIVDNVLPGKKYAISNQLNFFFEFDFNMDSKNLTSRTENSWLYVSLKILLRRWYGVCDQLVSFAISSAIFKYSLSTIFSLKSSKILSIATFTKDSSSISLEARILLKMLNIMISSFFPHLLNFGECFCLNKEFLVLNPVINLFKTLILFLLSKIKYHTSLNLS